MATKDDSAESLKQQILALDDQIEALVTSLDPDAPETHADVYTRIEKLHAAIFALKQQERATRA